MRSLPLLVLLALGPALTATAQPFEVVETPNPSPVWSLFRGVGGTSATDVWAVGDAGAGPICHILYHWDGTDWSETPAPHVNDREHILFGVSALAPDVAWAAGLFSGAGSLASGYILRWDGADWDLDYSRLGWPISDVWAISEQDV